MINTFLGEEVSDWANLQMHYKSLGFKDAKEYLHYLQNKMEYQATVGLLEARLERIKKLSSIEIKD